jgi:hypothetical protein
VVDRVLDLLYFDDDQKSGIVPVVSYESGVGPTAGFKAFHDDVAGHGESLSLDARFGGRYTQGYQLEFGGERILGSPFRSTLLTRFELAPRLLFQGIGDPADSPGGVGLDPRAAAVETRYRERRFLGLARLGATLGEPGGQVIVGGSAIFNDRVFDGASGPDLSTARVYDTARLEGFEEGARTLELTADLVIDTRDAKGRTGSGLYFEAFAGGVPPANRYRFAHAGAEATAYLDLYRKTRVLVLRVAHEAAFASEPEDIPFSSLPRLGGSNRLRGYTLDQFRDMRTGLATVEYHYPIHELVGGSLFADFGRVAPSYRDLMELDAWRWGVGGGFIVRSRRRILFTVDVAYGDGIHLYFTTDPLRAFDQRGEQL